jgi:hypothetical protein
MFLYPDYTHYLNANLNGFYLVTGGDNGNEVWRDLCGRADATLDVNALTGFQPSSRQGQRGSIQFAGGTETASVINGGGINQAATGTVSLWVKWTSTTQELYSTNLYGCIFGRSDNVSFVNQTITLDGANPTTAKVTWRPYAGLTIVMTSTNSPGLDVWRHILISWSSGNHRMWMDGLLEDTGSATGALTTALATPLSIGSLNASSLIGNMDCVRIFTDRFFSDEEAFDEYQHTSDYCRGLLMERRSRRIGRTFNPAWARNSNVLISAGGVL